MREHRYWVYILVSHSLSTMYIGVTNDLGRRIEEHRLGKSSESEVGGVVFLIVLQ
ncbi:MAG TPA: GIY-YIG nuclease family protein [Reyranella sp.]|nr:GIY-YIG nuclease family protein [Reyranella sp.]